MPQINILLGILMIKADLVRRLTKVRGARHADVSIGHVEATRVTNIPFGIMLCHIGIWLSLDICLSRGATYPPLIIGAAGGWYGGTPPAASFWKPPGRPGGTPMG
jgi:hypothetical protein